MNPKLIMVLARARELATRGVNKYVDLFARGSASRGLYGRELAQRARQHGTLVWTQDPSDTWGQLVEKLPEGLQRLGSLAQPVLEGSNPARVITSLRQVPKGFKGVVVNFSGQPVANAPRGYKIIGQGTRGENKLLEGRRIHALGAGPRTVALTDIVRKYRIDPNDPKYPAKLRAALKQEFKPDGGQYIVKDQYGAASLSLPTETTRGDWTLTGSRTKDIHRGLVQQRVDLMPEGRIAQFLRERFPNHWTGGLESHLNRGVQEFRVHAVGGRVVPGASIRKAMPLDEFTGGDIFKRRRAEKFLQDTLNKMSPKHRQFGYGADVAFDAQGRPFIIEMNPSTANYRTRYGGKGAGGGSGFADTRPHIVDAFRAAVTGEIPRFQAIRRAALTTAGVPAGAAAVNATLEKESAATCVIGDFVTPVGETRQRVSLEIADTPNLRRVGLSKRAALAKDRGMFFDKVGAYWMKDVYLPLDLLVLDDTGTVVEKFAMPVESNPEHPLHLYVPSIKRGAHAVELPQGSAVNVGDRFRPTSAKDMLHIDC